jgi:nitroreductase
VEGETIMDAIEAIRTRRSVRRYRPDKIPEEMVQALLEAATLAPSAGNQQSWQFLVVDERTLFDQVARVSPYAGMLKLAPLAILVCGDLEREKYKGYWVQDCVAATMNILTAARALGLGSCWAGVYPMADRVEGVRRLLGFPDSIVPLNIIAVGFPAEEKPQPERHVQDRVHRNH